MTSPESAIGRVYPKAPIVEAVIDIQVSQEADRPLNFSKCVDAISSKFPQKHPITMFEMRVGGNDAGSTKTEVGQRLVNDAGDRIVLLQQRGFTYSHMPPYTHWDIFKNEAVPLWQSFIDGCQPKRITRVALRYINRLKLPTGKIELEDYLELHPKIPVAMPDISGLLMQIQMVHGDVHSRCRSVVTIASEQAVEPTFQPIVLDLDVFVESDMALDSDDLWPLLDKLRRKKNELFEAALTEKMKGEFV